MASLRKVAATMFAASCLIAVSAMAHAESGQAALLKFDGQAKEVVAKMTLEEKIGQMMQPDQSFLKDPSDIAKYYMGSLLNGGSSGPKNGQETKESWSEMVEGYQKQAQSTRLGIPLLYGVDAVHGHNNILGATLFPHNIGLGCMGDPALVEKIQRITSEEVRATAINWVFAPCVTVPQDIRWGRTYEGFSDDPEIVKELGAASVRGFQGDALDGALSTIACAKHFVGDGGTAFGSAEKKKGALLDQGDMRVDEQTLRRLHLQGFVTTVNAGVATIMPSYSSWNGVKCSGNKYLLTDLLKKELGFEGFLISDYNAVDQISPDYKKAVETSINAGMDMVMMTETYPKFFATMQELVNEKRIPMERIDDAVTRILRVKFAAGLMESKLPAGRVTADRELWKNFGSPEHRAVARQAVRESMVLLKNQGNLLPLGTKMTRIQVVGRKAEDVGFQSGGWTIDWQGKVGLNLPGATSILAGIKEVAGAGRTVTYTREPEATGIRSDCAIVVIGEAPYAEFKGDRADLSVSKEDRDLVAGIKAQGIPVIVVLLSGRPMILGDLLEQADAVVAAWLPGSEGAGVADVLFGAAKATGKLSYRWPRSMEQLPGGADEKGEPLFKLGYGLKYGE